ncbi:50S ribosomal protein L16 [Geodia barretti]|uniref:Large ribosomal subunit protein uL16m n=1 Tax=Geodia barretti TaxID=519541 RepID=A0AA35XDE4_GEOBA|nr:50S ribosomal protein L16 [Geodia barretti]
MHRGRRRGTAQTGNQVTFGDYGLKATSNAWVTSRQIEAARRAITRHFRRGGQVWIRVFPDKPITSKPAETRMGSGKGNVDFWVAVVKPGRVLFEVAGIRQEMAQEALRLASQKLSLGSELDSSYRELMNLRFRLSTRQIDSPKELKNVKKTIARVKTVMRQRGMRER